MSNEDQKNYAQIIELANAIKKKLSTTWRSEQLDKQAISDLKFAISKKKDILDDDGVSKFDKLVKDFENWVYEVDASDVAAFEADSSANSIESHSIEVSTIANQAVIETNRKTI